MSTMNLMSEAEKTDILEEERQHRYLEAARTKTALFREIHGHAPTCHVTNFGCQMNARDSEKLLGILRSAGYEETESEDADFLIYNTCTVRDNADQRVFGRLGIVSHYKKKNRNMKVALCGCMMQESTNVEKIRKSYPFVDLIFGTHNLFRFPEYLWAVNESNDRIIDIWDSTDRIIEDLPVARKYRFKSGINISFGCDNYCTYCIVPYVRGRERSREPKEILKEVRNLVKDGVTEIMLLGQNVNSYGKGLKQKITFAELIRQVAAVDGVRRVRFMTPHPKDLSDDLLQAISENEKIARHIHLPLQSGSSALLKKMNRRYDKEQYIALAKHIREVLPDASISTDIIVGFPGETAADVDDTIDVINQVQFDNAFTFIYSIRRGTPAAAMEQVPEEEKKIQFDRVLSAVQENARKRSLMLQGQVMTALIEEINEQDPSLVSGRLSNNMLVHIPGDSSMIGKYYPVSLDECRGFYYFGSIVGDEIE